ncbi:TetR/AcrR family transcriptional regulator [Lentzea cavernae]|uniref:TetR/AcrR family transcriptional regulator n=1 Tax=Lentzea cavernae TaxID=2020703 RepID=UPI001E31E39B|nr:TetR/AcrR family transcriptional regulator [Lentzea cavernae]
MAGTQGAPMGRPREFDTDEALDRAMEVFWRQGYEATTLGDLTAAMNIGKPSLYAAFGNKEQLFRLVLDRYSEGPGSYGVRAAEQPTARQVVEAFLKGTVETTTQPQCPQGCLGVQGALAASDDGVAVHDLLAAWRERARGELELRFRRAVAEGDLRSDADPGRLARYVMTLSFGLAVQAAGGVARDELFKVVDEVMLSWRS